MRSLQQILSETVNNAFVSALQKLDEMAASVQEKQNDEHDLVDSINSIPKDHLKQIKSPDHFHDYVDKAVKTKGHPMHGKDPESIKRYSHAVHALLNHRPHAKAPSIRENLEKGGSLEVYGGSKKDNKHSDEWKAEGGGGDTTPKTDIISRDKKGKKHATISLKEGDRSQLMSGEADNVRGVYGVAANRMTKDEKKRKDIKDRIAKVTDIQERSKTAKSEKERTALEQEGREHLRKLHEKHPDLQHHVAHVASTGEGMFEKGSDAIADHVLSYKRHEKPEKRAAKISDPSKKGELETSMRFAKGKGNRYKMVKGKKVVAGKRSHALRIDAVYRT